MDGQKTIQEAHEIATLLEGAIHSEFGPETGIETHIEPLYNASLNGVDVSAEELTTLRNLLEKFAAENGKLGDIHKLFARKTDKGLVVTFHCHTEPERIVTEVHEAIDALERLVRQAHPGIWRIVGHAEPKAS